MHREGYCSWVCVSVCVSVKSHLTYGASVHSEKAVTYSTGNEGQNICGFSLIWLCLRVMAWSLPWSPTVLMRQELVRRQNILEFFKRPMVGSTLAGIRVNVSQRATSLTALSYSLDTSAYFPLHVMRTIVHVLSCTAKLGAPVHAWSAEGFFIMIVHTYQSLAHSPCHLCVW